MNLEQRVLQLEKEVAALKAQLEERPEAIDIRSVDAESLRQRLSRINCNDLIRKYGD